MKNKVAVSGGNAPGSYHSLREQCFPKGHRTCSNECSVFLRTPARTLLTYQALKNVWHQLSLSEFLSLLTIGNSHVMNISLILLAPYVAKCFIYFLLSPLIPKEIKISGSSFSPGKGTSDWELKEDGRKSFFVFVLSSDGNFLVCWKMLSMKCCFSWSLVPLAMSYECAFMIKLRT